MPTTPGKMMRVSVAPLAKARELLPAVDRVRFGPGESKTMTDRELLDLGMGWFIGRLQGQVFSKEEVDDTALRTVVDVLGQHLGVTVNGLSVDGQLTLSWESPDHQLSEVTVTVTAA